MSGLRTYLSRAGLGLTLGYALSRLGFSDYGELHAMLTFADPRLLFVFAGAVAVAMAGFFLLARGRALPKRPIRAAGIAGGLLFGAGWTLSGACPTVVPVLLGEGQLVAGGAILAGIFAGSWLCAALQRRGWVHAAGSCLED